jgi:BirA family biotin operon repressor/biotin-[acetyl-CoA-carboxylase] ligase
VAVTGDLAAEPLAAALAPRAVRAYPALLSTEPEARAWARAGAPAGSVVVADYQASPRGHAGFPWTVAQGRGLGFSVVARPELSPERDGWPYLAAQLALHDLLGGVLEWPDVVRSEDGQALARVVVHAEVGEHHVDWVVVTVLVEQASPPRGPLLAALLSALEHRLAQPVGPVLADYRAACATLGRSVRARLVPLGPGGREVVGVAEDLVADGALVLRTARGSRVAVPPLSLGVLDEPAPEPVVPEEVLGRFPR